MDTNTFRYQMTSKIRKKFLLFLAFHYANLLGQLLIVLWLLVIAVLCGLNIFSPNLSENFGYYLLAYGLIFLLVMGKRYHSLLKNSPPLTDSPPTLSYTLMPGYIRFYNNRDPEDERFIHYQDVGRIISVGHNLFFWAQWKGGRIYYFIPSEAFESSGAFREAKKYLEDQVRQLGRPELKSEDSILGSFFHGVSSVLGEYVFSMLKILALLLVVLLGIVFIAKVKTLL